MRNKCRKRLVSDGSPYNFSTASSTKRLTVLDRLVSDQWKGQEGSVQNRSFPALVPRALHRVAQTCFGEVAVSAPTPRMI